MPFSSSHPTPTIPARPVSDFVLGEAAQHGDRPAFVDGPSGRSYTFAQVIDLARRGANSLAARGLGKGDVVALHLPNLPEFPIAFHAVVLAGGVVTTANPLYTPEELAHQLGLVDAKYLVTVAPFLPVAQAAAAACGVEEIFVIGDAEGATPFVSLFAAPPEPPTVEVDLDRDLVVVPFSSGTSGRPKGVMLNHRNVVSVLHQAECGLVYTPEHRLLAVLPFFHIYGMQALMNGPLVRGSTVVTMPRFELEQYLSLIQEHRITHLFVVPPIALALAKHPLVDQYDLSSVSYVMSGAAPLDGPVQDALQARLGVEVVQGYGMTETSIAIAIALPSDAKGSVGELLPLMEGKIVDLESGAEVADGERGELCVRGPNVMQGYYGDADATASTIDADSWLHTGDVAYRDAEGALYIVDRVKELIKYKGMQVAPAELEGLLLTHPAVADAAVIPSPDDEAGEVPKAFVVLRSEATPDELMAWVAERVAPFKKVRRLDIVESVPKSPTGKILRRVLVDQERAARG